MINTENWLARGKAEAEKGVPLGDRFVSTGICIFSILMIRFFIAHQTKETGFFTDKFGAVEIFMFYGFWVFWIITSGLEGVLGQRLLSRLVDSFGGIIFAVISIIWIFTVFPFEFTYFPDTLPDSLRFMVEWISNDIARALMIPGIIFYLGAAIYSPVAYKFVVINNRHDKTENDKE